MMLSLNCPTSPVYRTSVEQKKQAQEAAKKRRGTPKALRDLLRENCRIRVQEARQNSFQKTRLLDVINEQSTIDEVLRREVAELEKDVDLQEQIYKELRSEADEWFAEQHEKEENYLIEFGETDVLICPVCQKLALDFMPSEKCYKCFCGASFLYTDKASNLRSELEIRVSEHESQCPKKLMFFTEPFQYSKIGPHEDDKNKNVLSAMCEMCEYFVTF